MLSEPRRSIHRIGVLALLVGAFVGLALYFDLVERSTTVWVHLAYVPIVLAAMWWGWAGVAVAGLQGAVLLALRLFGVGVGAAWTDAVRIALFLIVGVCVAVLAERLRSATRSCEVSSENYRTLFDRSLAGIAVYRDERVVLTNRRFDEMLGYELGEAVGRTIWEVIHPDDHAAIRARLARRALGETPDLHYEARFRHQDGRVVWVDLASSSVHYDGAPGILVNVYDITSRKASDYWRHELSELAREQAEQLVHSGRLAELGEMAAAVAHELNQPLTSIRTFAKNAVYMLENQAGEPGEVEQNLRRISDQVDRAARIIGQMRQLARRSEPVAAPVDLNAVLTEALDFVSHHLRLSGIEVRFEPSRELPEVQGDRLRLEQVFLNLLTNARQAMEGVAERRLTITSRLEAGRACPAVVEIADTGVGFDAADVTRLFAPFFTTKQPGQGTGLGLSISLNIVKDHGGTIEAAGAPGRGATFTVRLPLGGPAAQGCAERHA